MEIDQTLRNTFPDLRVLKLEINDIVIKKFDSRLDEFKKRKTLEIREKFKSLEEVKSYPVFRAYRDFYWKVGIDPTKTRPAGEALARKILGGRDLPCINTFVDAYNIASAESAVAIAAFDTATIAKNSLRMRRAIRDELFFGIGMVAPILLSGVEVVIEDIERSNLIAVYPYRDSDGSKVTEQSHDVLVMMCGVPGIPDSDLELARKLTREYVQRYCEFSSK